jgi:hypothetical protein
MKVVKGILIGFLVAIIIIPVLILGFLGFIPGLSAKPRDLGIKYSEADLSSGRAKSQIVYEIISGQVAPSESWQTSGSRAVNTEFSSQEITAIMNNKPGIYYPYKNVQVKFNADGSGEISGSLIKDRIPTYAATFGAPQVAVDFAMKFLPPNPVFYLKGRATLTENKVSLFEPQSFQIGRIPLPVNMFLSFAKPLVKEVFAIDVSEMTSELSKVSDKKALIIDFINSRLTGISGFFAKNARMTENKLIFEGTLPEKESTAR